MKRHQVYHIVRREFLARVCNKAFIFSTVLVPVLLGAYTFLVPVLFRGTTTDELRLGLLYVSEAYMEEVVAALDRIERPKVIVVERQGVSLAQRDEVRGRWSERVKQGDLDGYLMLEPSEELPFNARYFARETGNIEILVRLEDALRSVLLQAVLEGTGVPLEKVARVQRAELEIVRISERGEEKGGFGAAFFSTFALAFLLYLAVLINGQGMAMAIVEEKASRLIEVILGAVTAMEFMTGKIIGVMLSGLTQLGIWVGCTLIAVLYALPAVAVSLPPDLSLANLVSLEMLFYFSVFFLLGYLLYTTIFAAVAATCTSTEELSQALFPAMLLLMVAFFGVFFAIPNPDATVTRVLSLIPFFTPLVMLARINVLSPPHWEILLGIILLIVGVLGCFWFCAKIFRFALLLHGKRPTFAEIVRTLRAA